MKSANGEFSLLQVKIYEVAPDDEKGTSASKLVISQTIAFDPNLGTMELPTELTAQLPHKPLWVEFVTPFGTVGSLIRVMSPPALPRSRADDDSAEQS